MNMLRVYHFLESAKIELGGERASTGWLRVPENLDALLNVPPSGMNGVSSSKSSVRTGSSTCALDDASFGLFINSKSDMESGGADGGISNQL